MRKRVESTSPTHMQCILITGTSDVKVVAVVMKRQKEKLRDECLDHPDKGIFGLLLERANVLAIRFCSLGKGKKMYNDMDCLLLSSSE